MDIKDVDLNLLVVLDALVRLRNVSRAAEALELSQPTVSFALGKLRRVFGDPLFVRAGRGIRPTPRAEALAAPLHEVLATVQASMLTAPRFDPATTERTFRFNMADIGEMVFLPAIRSHLAAAAPRAGIRTVSTPPGKLAEALYSGEVDLAVGYFPDLRGAGIYQQRLFGHSFVCIVRADHPRIGARITKKQFLEESHAVVHQEGKSHELFEHALKRLGMRRRIALGLAHFLAIPLVIAESDLIVTVPYAVARSFAKMADLKMLRPPVAVPQAQIKQHWHERFHRDPANRWMREIIAALFRRGG